VRATEQIRKPSHRLKWAGSRRSSAGANLVDVRRDERVRLERDNRGQKPYCAPSFLGVVGVRRTHEAEDDSRLDPICRPRVGLEVAFEMRPKAESGSVRILAIVVLIVRGVSKVLMHVTSSTALSRARPLCFENYGTSRRAHVRRSRFSRGESVQSRRLDRLPFDLSISGHC
jgi:hypothetical protein